MQPPRELWWVWTALAVPSWPVVYRYAGAAGIVVYSVLAAIALWVAPFLSAPVFSLGRRSTAFLAAALIAALVVVFAIGYPRANVQVPGHGSDDDDAHNVGVAALLAGESPYAKRTYLDNELHQLPGSFVLAAPFALAGTSALQNLVCLPLVFLLMSKRMRDPRAALAIACLVLSISAGVAYAIVTGSSYSWNAIWVLSGMWLVSRHPRNVFAAMFCGIAMCSRANFILLVLPLAGMLWRRHGGAVMFQTVGTIALTIAILIAPFVFDPAPFSPRSGFGRLEQLDVVAVGAGLAVLVLTAIAAVIAAFTVDDEPELFQASAMIQFTPIVAGMIISAWIDVPTALSFAGYASFASWFLLLANAPRIEAWLTGGAAS